MKRNLILFNLIILSFAVNGQIDSLGVFVVDNGADTNEILVKTINERTTFKFDVAKIYMAQSLFSVEHLLSNSNSSIEPEINIIWDPLDWVFDYYTANKINYNGNDSETYPNSIQFGFGFGYKRYINKRKNGLSGHYIGLKIRNHTGSIYQKLNEPYLSSLNNEPTYDGFINISELSTYYGYSIWIFDIIQIDPFVGVSIANSFVKHGIHEPNAPNKWRASQSNFVQPSIIFGFRLGFSSRLGRLFF